jgi:hypothetical protein
MKNTGAGIQQEMKDEEDEDEDSNSYPRVGKGMMSNIP